MDSNKQDKHDARFLQFSLDLFIGVDVRFLRPNEAAVRGKRSYSGRYGTC
jgi:hypothetical protein